VVGYDGSASGRHVVEGAARRLAPGDRLIIVRALEGNDEPDPAQYDQALQEMQAALDSAVLHGIDYEMRVVAGSPARALSEAARHCGASGIVIGTRKAPSRIGQKTIRSELEAGPVPVIALYGEAERESHPHAVHGNSVHLDGFDSFPASDPPSYWSGLPIPPAFRGGSRDGAHESRPSDRTRDAAVLVAIDDRPSASDALTLGRWFARAQGDDLLLAWVHPHQRLPSLLGTGRVVEQVRKSVNALASAVKNALPPELRPELRLLSGRSPAEALQAIADEEPISMIVVGASDRTGIGRITPGRTALSLLSESAVPIAIAPRDYQSQPGTAPLIGVGFDGQDEAYEALEWAAAFARLVGGRLRLIAVHQPLAFASVGRGTLATSSVNQVLRRELRIEAEKALEGLDGLSAEVAFRDGDPAAVLEAESDALDFLVLGSRGYGPLRSVLLGTVSEATLDGSNSPVVIVPRGGVTLDAMSRGAPDESEVPRLAVAALA
jgi:nucleotide-binding universal stress UspA family protein